MFDECKSNIIGRIYLNHDIMKTQPTGTPDLLIYLQHPNLSLTATCVMATSDWAIGWPRTALIIHPENACNSGIYVDVYPLVFGLEGAVLSVFAIVSAVTLRRRRRWQNLRAQVSPRSPL